MRNRNSVGGQRILPGSPVLEDIHNFGRSLMAQFREGMDRLHSERELSQEEQHRANNLLPNSVLAREYTALTQISQTLWEHALDKQQHHNLGGDGGYYSTEALGLHLIATANRWQDFKRRLNEQV